MILQNPHLDEVVATVKTTQKALSTRLVEAAIRLRRGPVDMRTAYAISLDIEAAADACDRLEAVIRHYEQRFEK